MSVLSLSAVGPVLAAELGQSARNEAARRHTTASTATVEIVRPADPRPGRSVEGIAPAQRFRIDLSV